jgi:hypothetical protein
MTKAVVLALLTCLAGTPVGTAAAFEILPARDAAILVDWQYPESLPPRFRNHCSAEYFTGRPYCADHCGSDYQFFYCSEVSFGCCHLGRGYCDIQGMLRCSP